MEKVNNGNSCNCEYDMEHKNGEKGKENTPHKEIFVKVDEVIACLQRGSRYLIFEFYLFCSKLKSRKKKDQTQYILDTLLIGARRVQTASQ